MEQNKAIVREFIEQVINQGKLDQAARYMTEDVVEQVPFPGQGPGLAGVVDVIRGMRDAFDGLHFSIQEQVAEGQAVVTRFEFTGTHRAAFLGVGATGKNVQVWGVVIDRLVEGRIADTRLIMDVMGLMVQLGAV